MQQRVLWQARRSSQLASFKSHQTSYRRGPCRITSQVVITCCKQLARWGGKKTYFKNDLPSLVSKGFAWRPWIKPKNEHKCTQDDLILLLPSGSQPDIGTCCTRWLECFGISLPTSVGKGAQFLDGQRHRAYIYEIMNITHVGNLSYTDWAARCLNVQCNCN
jgi:hypothetical protein